MFTIPALRKRRLKYPFSVPRKSGCRLIVGPDQRYYSSQRCYFIFQFQECPLVSNGSSSTVLDIRTTPLGELEYRFSTFRDSRYRSPYHRTDGDQLTNLPTIQQQIRLLEGLPAEYGSSLHYWAAKMNRSHGCQFSVNTKPR